MFPIFPQSVPRFLSFSVSSNAPDDALCTANSLQRLTRTRPICPQKPPPFRWWCNAMCAGLLFFFASFIFISFPVSVSLLRSFAFDLMHLIFCFLCKFCFLALHIGLHVFYIALRLALPLSVLSILIPISSFPFHLLEKKQHKRSDDLAHTATNFSCGFHVLLCPWILLFVFVRFTSDPCSPQDGKAI